MFWHEYKFRMLTLVRQKEEFFWNLVFPLIMGLFFFAAFSNLTEKDEGFHSIPVAAVIENWGEQQFLCDMLDGLSEERDGEEAMLKVSYLEMDEAEVLLEEKKISGIITLVDGTPKLTVLENGINETVLKVVLDKYQQIMNIIGNVAPENMQNLPEVIESIAESTSSVTERKLTDGETDPVMDFFYALIAMTCLIGNTAGQLCCEQIKANASTIGMRKSVSSIKRMSMILGDMLASYTVLVVANVILIFFLKYVLGINVGDNLPAILLVVMLGSLIAICFGMLVSSIPKLGSGAKIGINISTCLLSSFLSGLMAPDIKYMLAEYPIISGLNPATLISNALYSLNIYDTYERYFGCILTMAIMSVVLMTASILIARRETYDSI